MDARDMYHCRDRATSHRSMVERIAGKMQLAGMNPANLHGTLAEERLIWVNAQLERRRANQSVRVSVFRGGHDIIWVIRELRVGHYRVERHVEYYPEMVLTADCSDLYAGVRRCSGLDDYVAIERAAIKKFSAILREAPEWGHTDRTVWNVHWQSMQQPRRNEFKSRRGAIAFARRVKRGEMY